AMRAGKPTLIVPHAFDQFDNAERAARLGASRTLYRQNYDAAHATRELKRLLEDESYAVKAAEVGRVVGHEDGAAAACDLLESVWREA
ncbi:MAG: glycosyltransferase, partial [Pyrinomonadaceae bacterium]